jgi:dsRNA-specific ribonuclease
VPALKLATRGTGSSRRRAEQEAAARMLEKMGAGTAAARTP